MLQNVNVYVLVKERSAINGNVPALQEVGEKSAQNFV